MSGIQISTVYAMHYNDTVCKFIEWAGKKIFSWKNYLKLECSTVAVNIITKQRNLSVPGSIVFQMVLPSTHINSEQIMHSK
jgi:hypothetical protein